jgi:hypothetical protein
MIMKSEFEKFYDNLSNQNIDKALAKKIWDAAQRSVIRIIDNPPVTPDKGDIIRCLSLCHPNTMDLIREVIHVKPDTLTVYYMETKFIDNHGEELRSSGILGEVEIMKKKE